MEIFDILVIAFNIFAVVYAIIRKKTGIYLNKNTYEIEGNGVFYTGLAGIIFLVAIIIISPLGGYTVGFLCFNLMGLYMIYRWGCTRIVFFEDHISYRNLIGITRNLLYTDIIAFQSLFSKMGGGLLGYRLIFKDKRRLFFDQTCMNSLCEDSLVARIKKYSKNNGNKLKLEKTFIYPFWA